MKSSNVQGIGEIFSLIDLERIKKTTLDFVKISSPTGEEREFLEHYGNYLRDIGLDVELDYDYPNSHSPNVIAVLKGKAKEPVLQFDGHGDTIPVGTALPAIKGDRIFGRGACDMKAGLAAMAETARVLKESGIQLQGSLLLTAHGGEEAPVGTSQELKALLQKGIHGQACIIPEPTKDSLALVSKGMCNWNISIERPGKSIHEIECGPTTSNPIMLGHRFLEILLKNAASFSKNPHPVLGAESLFIGIFQGGDFFNRLPTECRLSGTRRYLPGKTFKDIKEEFSRYVEELGAPKDVVVEKKLINAAEPFEVNREEKIVKCLRDAHQAVTGQKLPFGTVKFVGEAALFNNTVGVPTVYHGVDGSTIHCDEEFVDVPDIVRLTKILIQTAINFLDTE
jgi:acetylornithine deacetylase/succinyl-diaminopimelate desuccinylase-like protein